MWELLVAFEEVSTVWREEAPGSEANPPTPKSNGKAEIGGGGGEEKGGCTIPKRPGYLHLLSSPLSDEGAVSCSLFHRYQMAKTEHRRWVRSSSRWSLTLHR